MRLPLPVRVADHEPLLDCSYFDAGLCRSCTLLKTPQDTQLAGKQALAESLLAPFAGRADVWEAPWASSREAFRNKVKLVVTGTVTKPNLGIIGPGGRGQDLRDCPLPTPGIQLATPALAQFIAECGFRPYDHTNDRGVLKFVIVTESPTGELMIRFVARRRGVRGMLFKMLGRLRELVPAARVVSLNVQPERKAVLEGSEEIPISAQSTLPMTLDVSGQPLTLNLRPQSFFQTNTDAAQVLYSRAVEWVHDVVGSSSRRSGSLRGAAKPVTAWDLYCGVGGFGLALAGAGMRVIGVEAQEQAVGAARESVEEMRAAGLDVEADFVAADATEWARAESSRQGAGLGVMRAGGLGAGPDVVVVNPPRRGIGRDLAEWIAGSGVDTVLYSSCNARSMAADLAAMRDFEVVKAQVVDMFAHTEHFETVALLKRARG
ncbi:hypothetical protein [Trueperella pyogenes]|uniref:hypothetical protein n=1 Tax=Trueperella pyogenes TaxID=1661 RepID=UPI003246B4E1